ncbi:MAG TPA: ATP-binding protein [Planctomycetota bacterium]|nr:ATP-binding protein [Planctomycetota bacterium]
MNSRARILLVDDQAGNLEVLETVLASPDHELVQAHSAEEALLALLGQEFAAIVLDIRMPGMSGIELAQIIKQRKRTQHVPILFLTAYLLEETDILRGYGAGAVDYLSKPINPEILRSKVAVFVELFRKSHALASANADLENEITERKRAQDELRQVNEALEARVAERTSELSQANDAMRESENRLRMAAEVAGTVVADVELPSGHVRGGSDLAHLLGLPGEEVLLAPTEALALVHPDDRERVRRSAEAAQQAGSSGLLQCEHRMLCADGTIRWVDVRACLAPSSAGDGNAARRFVCVVLDITARKEADAEMRRKTLALEQQNRLLDEFAHLVSHDLKAPLRGICHVAEWLRSDHREALGAAGRGHLDLLVERSQKMNALIQGLLERARAGQDTGRDEAFDAGQALATVIAMLSPPSNITITTRPLPQIHYDRLHFERILQNLIGNAIQHMGRPNGHVSVEVDELPEAWRFAIRDDGIGIADQDQPRVFDMFVAGRPSDKNGTSGVGLAIVRSIVERHGGRVWVESAPGRGSCFFFTVPRTASTQS